MALVAAGVTALLAQGKVDKRNKELDQELPDAGDVKDLGSSADTYAITTDVLATMGIVGIGTGVVLWLLDDGSKSEEADVAPVAVGDVQWSLGLGTVTARGHF